MRKRETAILYSGALCNLNCSYCFINKNKALNKIDKIIEDSFLNPDYYFNFIKEYFPLKSDLERLEVWGAETIISIERIFPVLHKLIDYYPFFNNFFISTNFSYDTWNDKLYNLLEQFGKYPERKFRIGLQFSLDGPEEFTDSTRGIGTTKKCLKNYNLFLENSDKIPKNVFLDIGFKPTLSISTIYLLNTKESIINYYKFFEQLIGQVEKIGSNRISVNYPIPNMGVPTPATKKDGEYFANLVKNCREIERENRINKIFDYYKNITPFGIKIITEKEAFYNYNTKCKNCGTGGSMIGFLPYNKISACHNSFVEILKEYEESIINSEKSEIDEKTFQKSKSKFCYTKETYPKYERQMSLFIDNYFQISALAGYIRTLALAGEIDEKYKQEKEAVIGANLFQECTVTCVRDNYMVTGSLTLPPEGMIKLLLNGAIDYIVEGEENVSC